MDSGSAYIVLVKSEWCHSGIIEHFDIFKMASKMEANYKLKNCVIWKNVSNPFLYHELLAHNKNLKIDKNLA